MKELSIEEKTKAYNKASYNNYKSFNKLIEMLESVKNAIKEHNYGIAMNILCKPYPEFQITTSTELKESEDERIRKELIKETKGSEVRLFETVTNEELVAWLEKQGVQKPANKVESNKKFTPIESALKDLICDVDNSYTIEQVRRFLFEYGYKDKILNAAQEEMQKPAWSEEDESYLNTTIAYLKDAKEFKKTAENCINWLKSLKPQNRWKPSDELDEASYQVGVKRVLENPESYGLTKYNWKPSDEQMIALRQVISGCSYDIEPLLELETKLKEF